MIVSVVKMSKSLTDATIPSGKPSRAGDYVVGGVDGRGSGIAYVLQVIVQTLVHLIVVPNKATTLMMINADFLYILYNRAEISALKYVFYCLRINYKITCTAYEYSI